MIDNNIIRTIEKHTDYHNLIYCKGFLISSQRQDGFYKLSYCKNWSNIKVGSYFFYYHPNTKIFLCEKRGTILFLIGHAYNPYDKVIDENEILIKMIQLDGTEFWEYESRLTGIYIMGKITSDGGMIHWSDCAGMLISYYGEVDNSYFVTSHVNLVASLHSLTEDKYVKSLKNSRYFRLFGPVLPGDLSVYKELKRTVPNHWYGRNGLRERYFPLYPIRECESEDEYHEVLVESASILKTSLQLCSEKWNEKNVAISLTGGKDSGETFASANGFYNTFSYFSYISKPEEEVDANAAHEMCDKLNIPHRIITIPNSNSDISDFELLNNIIYINCGSVGRIGSNEIRKRSILIKDKLIDVEVKSWVNEIVRAYWYKKYSLKAFPSKPTGKYLSTLYKVFLFNRILFLKTSKIFDQYISEYMRNQDIDMVGDWTTLWSWEFGFSAGEGQSLLSEHMLSFDITIPFNNRRLIALMLKPKLEDRISDRLQKDIININNPEQAALNINIVNAAHTKKRANFEKLYLLINTHLPF